MQLLHARHHLEQTEGTKEAKNGEAQVEQEEHIRGNDDDAIKGVDEIG